MEKSKRKHPRLKNYDYSQNGVYFVTICTKDRGPILSKVVGRDDLIPPQVELTPYGEAVAQVIGSIHEAYPSVVVEKFVIMPNHLHLLLGFSALPDGGMGSSRPTLTTMIRALKSMVTRMVKQSFWQASFYEHIIREEHDF